MKALFKAIYFIFLTLSTTVAVLLAVSALPIKNNFKFFVVLSGSMEPAIKTGSVAVSLPQKNYGPGDVINFKSGRGKEITTHRIVEKVEGGFKTRGDANDTPDQALVDPQNIVGKTAFSLPLLGYLVEFAKSPKGFILLIVVPATVLIWEEIKSLISLFKKPEKPKTLLEELKEERSFTNYPAFIFILITLVMGTTAITFAKSFFIDKEISVGSVFSAIAPTLYPENEVFRAAPTLVSPLVETSLEPSSTPTPTLYPENEVFRATATPTPDENQN